MLRYLRIGIFLAALMVATGVFLPFVQLGIGGFHLGQKSSLTLYSAVNRYSIIEKLADATDATPAERLARGLIAELRNAPSLLGKRIREAEAELDNIREAKEAARLDTIGTVLRVTSIVFLLLLGVIMWLVSQMLSRPKASRAKGYWTLGLNFLVSALGIGLFVGTRFALAEGNKELGAAALSFGSGAYMLVVGSSLGLAFALAAAILGRRDEDEGPRHKSGPTHGHIHARQPSNDGPRPQR